MLCTLEYNTRYKMDQYSEIILKKMVDHFGKWEEPVLKSKINYKKKEKYATKEKTILKEVLDLDKNFVRQRRDEIQLCIEEIKCLNSSENTKIKVTYDSYAKKRQEELIYVKNILQAEVNLTCFGTI